MIDCYVKEVWKQKVETAVLVSGKASPSWKDLNSQSMEKVRCRHVRLCATDIVGSVVKQSTSLDVILDNQQEHWFIWENFLISWKWREESISGLDQARRRWESAQISQFHPVWTRSRVIWKLPFIQFEADWGGGDREVFSRMLGGGGGLGWWTNGNFRARHGSPQTSLQPHVTRHAPHMVDMW